MKHYYCGFCNVHALAINYNDETPTCMCGREMEEEE